MDAKIYIIHENDEWVVPLRKELEARELPYAEWFLAEGQIALSQAPPEGVFYNRMSASSHTRGHRYAPELTAATLAWLEHHGRRVFNGSRALQLEVSKVAQYMALEAHGVKTPRTFAAVGRDEIIACASRFESSFITKHNRAGKGLGVQLFHSIAALEEYVRGDTFEPSIDGITLLQEYIQAPAPFITRTEFVGGKFLYAVKVDTSEGFELCPADVCQLDDQFCPVGESEKPAKFQIIEGFSSPLLERYEAFLAANDIHIAGIEFIVDEAGTAYTYDVNTNTNYNPDAEATAGRSGMGAIAQVLGEALAAR